MPDLGFSPPLARPEQSTLSKTLVGILKGSKKESKNTRAAFEI